MKIYLLGFMGSGKSYLGSRLAEQFGFDFVDLDDLIEERTEKSISEIFEEEGEMNFRLMESACLKSLGTQENLVIACGGGTPCFFDNMDWMLDNGRTVFLNTPVELLLKRLRPELTTRPLLAGKNEAELILFLKEKLEERMPVYQRAKMEYLQVEEGESAVADLKNRIEKNW